MLIALLVAEANAPLAVLILQPGFDKGSGPLDLDFDFVVQMAWCFVVLWLVGFVASWSFRKKKKKYLVVHLASSPLFLAVVIVGFFYYRK